MTTTTNSQQVAMLGRLQAGLFRIGLLQKSTKRAAELDAAVEDNSGLISGEKFDIQKKKEILYTDTVSFTSPCMQSPDGKIPLDTGHVAAGEEASAIASPSANVVQQTRVDVAALLGELSSLRDERDAAHAERDLMWERLAQAQINANVHALKVAGLVEENANLRNHVKRLLRPRAIVGRGKEPDGSTGDDSLLLTAELIRLKQAGDLPAYTAGSGRNSPHPDLWIESALRGLLSKKQIELAKANPAVWQRVNYKLYKAKAMRNLRAGGSNGSKNAKEHVMVASELRAGADKKSQAGTEKTHIFA